MANRYMYIPMLGLLIMAVWGVRELMAIMHYRKVVLSLSATVVLLSLGVTSRRQVWYWRDDTTLFRHTAEVTPNNWWAYKLLGRALVQQGRFDEAINSFKECLRIVPDSLDVRSDLGYLLLQQGRFDDAINLYRSILPELPDANEAPPSTADDAPPVIATDGKTDAVIRFYTQAHVNLGAALERTGQLDEAIRHYREAIRIKPDYALARKNLGNAYLQQGKFPEAILQFDRYLVLDPGSARIHGSMGYALMQTNELDEAVAHLEEAARLEPGAPAAYFLLGTAYWRQDRAILAIETLKKALALANTLGDKQLAGQIQGRLDGYQAAITP